MYFYRWISSNLSCKMVNNKSCVSLQYQNIQSELAVVLDALCNERNLTLLSSSCSERAYLIRAAFSSLEDHETDIITYYVDISDTHATDDFIRLLSLMILGKEDTSLQGTMHYLSSLDKWVYIAIDNFQQILQYPEKGVDALIRSYVQELSNVTFIFAGNNENKMYEMFVSPAKPFYHSTQILTLT